MVKRGRTSDLVFSKHGIAGIELVPATSTTGRDAMRAGGSRNLRSLLKSLRDPTSSRPVPRIFADRRQWTDGLRGFCWRERHPYRVSAGSVWIRRWKRGGNGRAIGHSADRGRFTSAPAPTAEQGAETSGRRRSFAVCVWLRSRLRMSSNRVQSRDPAKILEHASCTFSSSIVPFRSGEMGTGSRLPETCAVHIADLGQV